MSESTDNVMANSVPAYKDVHINIHPSKWTGGELPTSVRKELISRYNVPGKKQVILTQAPILIIRTYN